MKKRFVAWISVFVFLFTFSLSAFAENTTAEQAVNRIADARNAVVSIMAEDEFGTTYNFGTAFGVGAVAGEDAMYLVTNRHCVTMNGNVSVKASKVYVLLDDQAFSVTYYDILGEFSKNWDVNKNRMLECDIVYYNEEEEYPDIAVLKVLGTSAIRPITALPLGAADQDDVGSTVYAIGYPGNAADDNIIAGESELGVDTYKINYLASVEKSTTTNGIISNISKVHQFGNTLLIKNTCKINNGNSGGPLLNEAGIVIGINTYGTSDTVDTDSYSVDISYVTKVLDDLGIAYCTDYPQTEPEPTPTGWEKLAEFLKNIPVWVYIVVGCCAAGVVVLIVLLVSQKKKNDRQAEEQRRMLEEQVRQQQLQQQQSAGAPFLQSYAPQHRGATVRFRGDRMLIGRKPDCGLIFANGTPGISGTHCSVQWDAGQQVFTVIDLKSSNGTFLSNGVRMEPMRPYTMRAGDSFYLGEQANTIRLGVQ